MLSAFVSAVEAAGFALAEGVFEARFNGVSGVSVVCGDGALPIPPDTEWTPATTDAAVAPCGACARGPSEAAAPPEIMPFRAAGGAPPMLALLTTPTDAERVIGLAMAAVCAAAEAMVGNPVPVLAALDMGVGTSVGAGFVGSSNSGAGNTGEEELLPVPEGPPPPILRRGAVPEVPCEDALRACCTICCWRAKTSRPLVT